MRADSSPAPDRTAAVLVIDDDVALGRTLTTVLGASGYRVTVASCGLEGLYAAEASPPDLVLLDLGLGDLDGIEVCRRLRSRWVCPIVVVSGDVDERRKIAALDAGANDYVTKPFSVPELLARLRAALRSGGDVVVPRRDFMKVGDLVVDIEAHAAVAGGALLALTRIEFALLAAFARSVGELVTHEAIDGVIWPHGPAGSPGAVRVHIANLRRKLGTGPERPRIVSVPGLGYRLTIPD